MSHLHNRITINTSIAFVGEIDKMYVTVQSLHEAQLINAWRAEVYDRYV